MIAMSGRMKVHVCDMKPRPALFQFIKVLRHKVMQLIIPERAEAEFQTNDASLKFNVPLLE